MSGSWAVVQTHPNATNKAIVNLERQGFEVYDPREAVVRIVRGQKVVSSVQLFANYLFVGIVSQWWLVKYTYGVCDLLMAGEQPAFLSSEIVVALRARENDAGLISLRKTRFMPGEAVRVLKGAMQHELGIYDGQSTRDRVFVLMAWLGAQRRVEIAEANLVAA